MRGLVPVGLLVGSLCAGPVAAAAEDDPKIDRVLAPPAPEHKAPLAKLSYRRLTMHNLDGSDLPFNGGALDIYAISRPWIRLGVDAEVAGASGMVQSRPTSAWYFGVGLSLGVQYPWRVTPFVEGRFIAGFMGGDVAGTSAVTYTYIGGIDGGIELYVFDRFYLSAAIGWARPTYRGIDLAATLKNPQAGPTYTDITNDTLTFKIGLGI
jgi:hypothetical protein